MRDVRDAHGTAAVHRGHAGRDALPPRARAGSSTVVRGTGSGGSRGDRAPMPGEGSGGPVPVGHGARAGACGRGQLEYNDAFAGGGSRTDRPRRTDSAILGFAPATSRSAGGGGGGPAPRAPAAHHVGGVRLL